MHFFEYLYICNSLDYFFPLINHFFLNVFFSLKMFQSNRNEEKLPRAKVLQMKDEM